MKSQWSNDPDRITYLENERVKCGEQSIDEMVIHNANVHLESLSDSSFMLIVDNDEHYWHLTISSRSGRAKVESFVYEGE